MDKEKLKSIIKSNLVSYKLKSDDVEIITYNLYKDILSLIEEDHERD